LEESVSDFLLNGVAEEGNPVAGILTTTGVVQTAYSCWALRTVRASIGQLEAAGITAIAVVLNPVYREDIETTLYTDGRFLLSNASTSRRRPGHRRRRVHDHAVAPVQQNAGVNPLNSGPWDAGSFPSHGP
jgi:hypothetical protein